MTVNHVAELCICLHSKLQHAAAEDVCSGCKCERFNPVSPKASRHAFKRGQKVQRRRVADLVPGNKVLTGWSASHGKVRLTADRAGAMVSEVKGRRFARPDNQASGQSWFDRAVVVTTDLGESVPQSGGTFVLVVR